MKKIWKFPLGKNPANLIDIYIPKGAKILTANVQRSCFTLWAEIETLSPEVTRKFVIYATGEPFSSKDYMKDAKYISTVFFDELVWHVFDLGES